MFFSPSHPAEAAWGQMGSIFKDFKIIANLICIRSVILSLPLVKPGHLFVRSNTQPRLRTIDMLPTC